MLILKLATVALQLLIVAVIVRELRHPLYRFAQWQRAWTWMLAMSLCMLALMTRHLFFDISLLNILLLAGAAGCKLAGLWRLSLIFGTEIAVSQPTTAAVVEVDGLSVIVAWDTHAQRLFGWTEAEALHKTLMQTIIPPRDWEAHRAGIARLQDAGDEGRVIARTFAVNAMRKAGNEIPVTIRITSVIQDDGSLHFRGEIRELGVL